MKRIAIFLLDALLIYGSGAYVGSGAYAFSQQPTAPAAAAKQEIVKPKRPYDDRDGKLATETENNLRLRYANNQRDLQDRVSALPQVQQMQAATAAADQKLDAEFGQQEKLLQAWTAQVRKDNGWDASYQWNSQTGEWIHSVTAPAPPPKADTKSKP